MGIIDKLKNALFEEEFVEVEEPAPKPKLIKKEKLRKENVKKEVAPSKPIAKKVILPEQNENHFEDEIDNFAESVVEEEVKPTRESVKFPMLDDNDFKVDDSYEQSIVRNAQVSTQNRVRRNESKREEEVVSKKLYGKKVEVKNDTSKPYEFNDTSTVHKPYDKKEDKTYFQPSPIISPIYGILDKNYKKEDVVSKREVRLTSSYSHDNISVDDVRRKAFGTISDDLQSIVDGETEININSRYSDNKLEVQENLLVDLSNDNEKPKVQEVTMGDAEEYFQDLGLEYNIDYKDSSRDVNHDDSLAGRHVKVHGLDDEEDEYEIKSELNDFEINNSDDFNNEPDNKNNDITMDNFIQNDNKSDNSSYNKTVIVNNIGNNDDSEEDDDNLFDLIDSMYEK